MNNILEHEMENKFNAPEITILNRLIIVVNITVPSIDSYTSAEYLNLPLLFIISLLSNSLIVLSINKYRLCLLLNYVFVQINKQRKFECLWWGFIL